MKAGSGSFRSPTRPNVAWDDPNLRFIDLTGDGRADLVITEREAFVWYRSLGEDGFGASVRVAQMLDEEHGPHLVFADTLQTIFLGDMNGDGLIDLVRIRNGEACYWPNLGYGRFGAMVTMDHAPWLDRAEQFDPARLRLGDIDGFRAVDLIYLGTGGAVVYFNQSGNSGAPPIHCRSLRASIPRSACRSSTCWGRELPA